MYQNSFVPLSNTQITYLFSGPPTIAKKSDVLTYQNEPRSHYPIVQAKVLIKYR